MIKQELLKIFVPQISYRIEIFVVTICSKRILTLFLLSFILEVAEICDGAIISNDSYKDLHNQKPSVHIRVEQDFKEPLAI